MIEEYIVKNLWCLTYAAVIASEWESAETAVLQANEAVARYREAWEKPEDDGGSLVPDGPQEGG